MIHREDDIAAYLLGALDERESREVRAHLEECPTCRAEYERLRVAADALPLAVEQHPAPHDLQGRLMASVRSKAKAPRRRWLPRWSPAARVAGALAGAAVLAVVLALTGVLSGGGAGVRTVRGQVIGTPAASAVLRVQGSRAELVITHMSPPPAGRIYEVWRERAGAAPQPTDALFGVTRQGSAVVAVPGGVRGVRLVLVTAEPLGGSARPTRAPVIVVGPA